MKVHIYTKTGCPFCVNAKKWLTQRKVKFTETVLDNDNERQEFYRKVGEGVRTVPQVFLNGKRLGGFSELKKLDHLF